VKELIKNISTIAKNDRKMLCFMIGLFLASVALIVVTIINTKIGSNVKVWSRYASFGINYYSDFWYFSLAFIAEGLVLGILHNLLAVQLYFRKGKVAAIVLLASSLFLAILSAVTIFRINDINSGAL
jgi:hypothetical protein